MINTGTKMQQAKPMIPNIIPQTMANISLVDRDEFKSFDILALVPGSVVPIRLSHPWQIPVQSLGTTVLLLQILDKALQ